MERWIPVKVIVEEAPRKVGNHVPPVAGIMGGKMRHDPLKHHRRITSHEQQIAQGIGIVSIAYNKPADEITRQMRHDGYGYQVGQIIVQYRNGLMPMPAQMNNTPRYPVRNK